MPATSDHLKGLVVTAGGYIVLSPDALIIRLVSADHWTVTFWRGLLMAAGLSCLLVLRYRGHLFARVRAIGGLGLLAALVFSVSTISFVTAITFTTVANALVIISVAPLFAAVFSLIFLREPVPARTWIAIVAAVSGIAIIVYPSARGIAVAGQGTIGDLAALSTAIAIACFFVILRRARDIDMVPALTVSGLLTAAIMAPLSTPFMLTAADIGLLAILGIVITPIAFTMISAGPRYLSAPEVGLLMPMETVFSPLWVWLVLAEWPGTYALVGGAVVILTLVLHSAAALRTEPTAPISP
jgi:drug/metabolite transporter (DMT)-like permease